jgi:hypothetical protein
MLGRVLPGCSRFLAPLDNAIAGLPSADKMSWTDSSRSHFSEAQSSLGSHRSITLPRSADQMWIVTDGSVNKRGIGAALYITGNGKLMLAGFVSAKLTKHQVTCMVAMRDRGIINRSCHQSLQSVSHPVRLCCLCADRQQTVCSRLRKVMLRRLFGKSTCDIVSIYGEQVPTYCETSRRFCQHPVGFRQSECTRV